MASCICYTNLGLDTSDSIDMSSMRTSAFLDVPLDGPLRLNPLDGPERELSVKTSEEAALQHSECRCDDGTGHLCDVLLIETALLWLRHGTAGEGCIVLCLQT